MRSLLGLKDLVDRSLSEVRLDSTLRLSRRASVAALMQEVEIGAALQAENRGITLVVVACDRAFSFDGDWQLLAGALSNLLQNAFKFSRRGATVSVTARATEQWVFIDVADECGGLPAGDAGALFRPFEQRGADRSGVGLGLSISMKAVQANGGELEVRDVPGVGCVFTIKLPRVDLIAPR